MFLSLVFSNTAAVFPVPKSFPIPSNMLGGVVLGVVPDYPYKVIVSFFKIFFTF